jgi:hypothetical protein
MSCFPLSHQRYATLVSSLQFLTLLHLSVLFIVSNTVQCLPSPSIQLLCLTSLEVFDSLLTI